MRYERIVQIEHLLEGWKATDISERDAQKSAILTELLQDLLARSLEDEFTDTSGEPTDSTDTEDDRDNDQDDLCRFDIDPADC